MPDLVALFWYSDKFTHNKLLEEWIAHSKSYANDSSYAVSTVTIITAVIIVCCVISRGE